MRFLLLLEKYKMSWTDATDPSNSWTNPTDPSNTWTNKSDPHSYYLLTEDNSYLLLETGGKIVIEPDLDPGWNDVGEISNT